IGADRSTALFAPNVAWRDYPLHDRVAQLILAGGCAAIPGVDEQIEARVGTPTRIANPFGLMGLHSRINPQRLSNDAPALMIACGLALRSFD
ncbi:MAG: pilus assembly protein PilM, partial [Ectothiorhodospira sp.]